MGRESLSKKLRFEVFKRDSFCCQYCGSNPPNVVLEIDHIIPVSKKGTNEIDNLVTSCFNCNRGKGAKELNCLPQSTVEKTKTLLEKEEQYLAFKKLTSKIKNREKKEIESINSIFQEYYPTHELSDIFKRNSVKQFIDKLGLSEVQDAMYYSCGKEFPVNDSIKYFCGVCWGKIREAKNG